jgi:hypothetical protein
MGLKPPNYLHSINPFTKVNGNFNLASFLLPINPFTKVYGNSNFVSFLLPFALADGFNKQLLNMALATFFCTCEMPD